jgi:hypothetical protein
MRIANLIIGHKNASQLSRLVDRLQHPNFDVYIHIDKKVDIGEFRKLENSPRVFFITNRIKVNWGGNSTSTAIIKSLNEILESGKSYDFINLLSAQDYPLKTSEQIFEFFKRNSGQNFISYEVSSESDWWIKAATRYEKYHLTDWSFPGKYLLQNVINIIAPKRKFPGDMKLYGSQKSTWWSITGECARHVTKEALSNEKLNSFLKYCWGTDEFLVTTLIMNSPFKAQAVNNNLRYIDWSEGKPNPKTLTISDFFELKMSDMLFARKFDTNVDSAILDKIDNYNQISPDFI